MAELGPRTYYLGMTITRISQSKTTLTQPTCLSTYLDPVLKENEMCKCKHVVVPMGSHLSVAETGYEATDLVLVIKLYRKPSWIIIGH